MKKYILVTLIINILFLLTACAKVQLKTGDSFILNYVNLDKELHEPLSSEDTSTIQEIFNGKTLYSDSPSCGFNEDISIESDGRKYAIACDTCGVIKDCSANKYFNISDEERICIEEIFEKYDAYFPCE